MSTKVERVLDEIRALTPEEQLQLRALCDSVWALLENMEVTEASPQMSEEEFEQHLFAQGIISSIPTRDIDSAEYRSRKPIEVKGQPVSETLIEERR